jgi:hypothetical protein
VHVPACSLGGPLCGIDAPLVDARRQRTHPERHGLIAVDDDQDERLAQRSGQCGAKPKRRDALGIDPLFMPNSCAARVSAIPY